MRVFLLLSLLLPLSGCATVRENNDLPQTSPLAAEMPESSGLAWSWNNWTGNLTVRVSAEVPADSSCRFNADVQSAIPARLTPYLLLSFDNVGGAVATLWRETIVDSSIHVLGALDTRSSTSLDETSTRTSFEVKGDGVGGTINLTAAMLGPEVPSTTVWATFSLECDQGVYIRNVINGSEAFLATERSTSGGVGVASSVLALNAEDSFQLQFSTPRTILILYSGLNPAQPHSGLVRVVAGSTETQWLLPQVRAVESDLDGGTIDGSVTFTSVVPGSFLLAILGFEEASA